MKRIVVPNKIRKKKICLIEIYGIANLRKIKEGCRILT
jgi:hypothetical protein